MVIATSSNVERQPFGRRHYYEPCTCALHPMANLRQNPVYFVIPVFRGVVKQYQLPHARRDREIGGL
jgi:hypothetical protein